MKKHFKTLLSVLLVFAMLFSVTSVSFAETTEEDGLNWTVYSGGKLGTGGNVKADASVDVVTDVVYDAEDGDGDGEAYRLSANCYAQYVTCKLPVEANKYYEVSFNYYTGKLDGSGGAFSHVIVSKDGAAIKDYNSDYLAEVYRNFAYYTNKNGAMVSTNLRTTNNVTTNWNKMTVSFYSGNATEVVLAMRPTVGTDILTYVDNLQVNEVEVLAGADDILSDATAVVYSMSNLSSFADTNKFSVATYTFAKNTTNYTDETDADGDGQVYSMSANCYAQYATMQIPVSKNQNYKLSFKYHSTALDGAKAMFSDIRVIEYGAANSYDAKGNLAAINRDKKTGYSYNKNGVAVNTKINITEGTKTDDWNELTIDFYSRELSYVMLVLRPTVQVSVSIDDVSLTAVDSFTGSERIVNDFTIYNNETTILGTGGSVRPSTWGQSRWEYVTSEENLYVGAGADNDGEGYLFDTLGQWAVTKVPVKANTYYNLTFKYFGTELDGYQWGDDGMFSDVIVLPDGKAKNVVTDHLAYIGRNDAYYNNKNGAKIESENRVNSSVKANQWNEMSLSFYSGALTEVLLALRSTVATVYVDCIKLATASTLPNANLFPSGWTVYQMGNEGQGTDGVWEHTTAVIGESTEIIHSADGDGKSVVLGANTYAQYPTLPLITEKNKYYTLEFYYLSTAVNTGDNNKVFSDIYISNGNISSLKSSAIAHATTAADGSVIKNSETITVSGFTTRGATANEWQKVKITFYSGENESVRFAVRPAVSADTLVYIDDITLNDISVSTAYNQKAAIRVASNTDSVNVTQNGLRVYNSIQCDWLNEAEGNIVEYGSMVVRKGYLEENYENIDELDMEEIFLADGGIKTGVAYRAEGAETITGSGAVSLLWEENNTDDIFGKKVFTSYLTNISEKYYGDDYLIRAYAIDAEGNIFFGEITSVCIFDVAQAISEANSFENTFDNAAFSAFVIESGLQAEYEAWCSENALDVGGLYQSLVA